MKASAVRRKTKAQRLEQRMEEERKEQAIADKLAEYEAFKLSSAQKEKQIHEEKEAYR
jgi:hypothetical protein